MIEGKKVLAVIPARGGSKGVPRKNIKEVGGKPLIAWTIVEAKKSRYLDRIILSSEDAEIIQVAKEWGCEVPFVRPMELAGDTASSIDVILHALEALKETYDLVVILQPTSPLRTVEDIDGAIELCVSTNAPSVVSFCESPENPYWMFVENPDGTIRPFTGAWDTASRRQDLPTVLLPNGAVFVTDVSSLKETRTFYSPQTRPYVMPQNRSVDIDTEQDLQYVRFLMNKRARNHSPDVG